MNYPIIFKKISNYNLNNRLKVSNISNNIRNIKQLIFKVTESCNLACAYCAYGKYYSILWLHRNIVFKSKLCYVYTTAVANKREENGRRRFNTGNKNIAEK